jgi:hypothetical protein
LCALKVTFLGKEFGFRTSRQLPPLFSLGVSSIIGACFYEPTVIILNLLYSGGTSLAIRCSHPEHQKGTGFAGAKSF